MRTLPLHLRREGKSFSATVKVRIMVRARALMRRTEAGKHYRIVTAKALW